VEFVIESCILVSITLLLWHTYSDGVSVCWCVKRVHRSIPLAHKKLAISLLTVCIMNIFPYKIMEAVVKIELSLKTFLWSHVKISCHMWAIMCSKCDTQSVSQNQLHMILKNLLGIITESPSTFSPKLSRLHVLLGNIHQHTTILFTSVEESVWRQHVKWSPNCLWRHWTNLTCL
jgi:hypothetical protein